MAHDGELAEIARYAVRRRRGAGCKAIAEATDNKFQVQLFAAGEIVPGLQVLDAVQNGTVEMGHTASYYYFGKDPTFTFGTSVPFGPNQRVNQAWYLLGGGKEALERVLQKLQLSRISRRQYRLPDGRLVPQGNQHRRRSQGPEIPHRRLCRAACCRSLARCRSRLPVATSIPRSRRAPSTAAEWVGPYDDEKLGFFKVAPHYYYPGWWEGGPLLQASSISTNGMRCRKTIKTSSSRPVTMPTTG